MFSSEKIHVTKCENYEDTLHNSRLNEDVNFSSLEFQLV